MSINRALRYGTTVSVLALQMYDKNLKYANKNPPKNFGGFSVDSSFNYKAYASRAEYLKMQLRAYPWLRTERQHAACHIAYAPHGQHRKCIYASTMD